MRAEAHVTAAKPAAKPLHNHCVTYHLQQRNEGLYTMKMCVYVCVCVCVCVREREREREREGEGEGDRETERQTDRGKKREKIRHIIVNMRVSKSLCMNKPHSILGRENCWALHQVHLAPKLSNIHLTSHEPSSRISIKRVIAFSYWRSHRLTQTYMMAKEALYVHTVFSGKESSQARLGNAS